MINRKNDPENREKCVFMRLFRCKYTHNLEMEKFFIIFSSG